MLVKSLRNADHQRAVNESLRAACALCGTEVGCIALVRHGMLEVVQHFIMQLMAVSYTHLTLPTNREV